MNDSATHVLDVEQGVKNPNTASASAPSPKPPELSTVIREPAFSYVRHRIYNTLAFAFSDALALTLAMLAAGGLRLWLLGDPLIPVWSWVLIPAWWGGAALMRLLPGWGLGPVEVLRRLVLLLGIVYAGLAVALFLVQQAEDVSRLTVTLAFALSLFVVPFLRTRAKRTLISLGLWGVPTAIYGAGETGDQIAWLLRKDQGQGYDPIVAYDDDPACWGEHLAADVSVLGSAELVTPYAPVAILAMPEVARERQIELLEGPLLHYRTVLVIPNLFGAPSLWVRPRDLSGILGLEIKRNLSSAPARFLKQALDMGLTVATLPFWALPCLVLAALIWLEDGASPFFLQERIGKDGQPFKAFKFRTMVPNAEEVLRQRLEEDDALRYKWNGSYKLEGDPRVTRVGKVLRRFSLDELPQLVNVLRGEMSLVGPRPLPAYHHEVLSDQVRALRKHVRPGLTGLWQVTGRSNVGTEGMEKWDPYYVRNWSPWLDIVILVRTLRVVTRGAGAY